MFERYTEKARRTIFFARHEASSFGSPFIETEHLLLGLLNDGFLASFVLEGVSVQGIREHILATLPRQKEIPTSADLPLSNNAKQALSYGAEEADRLADRQIWSRIRSLPFDGHQISTIKRIAAHRTSSLAGIKR